MIELRDAVAADEARCMALLAELRDATGSTHADVHSDVFASLVDKRRGQIILAEEDGQALGMATVSYNLALRYAGEYCQLEELIVTPAARGKNLGGLLMERVVANAVERDCAEIGLYLVESTEKNQPFYEKYGFLRVGSEMRQTL